MGAYLNSLKSKALWKAAFQELETAGTLEADDENLFAHLRISYDGLSTRQSTGMQRAKEMFLDIACLMIGRTEAFAMEVWKRYCTVHLDRFTHKCYFGGENIEYSWHECQLQTSRYNQL